MAQGHLGAAQLVGHLVQDGAAQARAQTTGGLAFGHDALDDAVGVLVLDVIVHTDALEVLGQHMLGEAGLLLVQVHGHDVELHGSTLLQLAQNVEQGVAVLAAGHADHDLVAFLDHVVVEDGLAHFAAQALLELDLFTFDLDLAGLGGFFAVGVLCGRSIGGFCLFGNPGVVVYCIHGVHHCPVSMRMATSQSSKISSFAIFTRTPRTPGSCSRRWASLPIRLSSRFTCSEVHSSMMIWRTLR
ncbi:hypothetical protein SDC9_170626 [bioreactor metagenome]|uniref:NAD-specific glutamate dehydrogenase n=1 Tax=bioreactor metagenome TaxID=1076179 RepID=A0A645G8L7_9ZZZZ